MEKAIIKFNGGNLALLCSRCRVIIKTGKDFTQEELDYTLGVGKTVGTSPYLPPQYCESCKNKENDK